jgi:hypothetical protein
MLENGNIFMHEAVDAMLCAEKLAAELPSKVPGCYVNCDFTVDMTVHKAVLRHPAVLACVNDAVNVEGEGHVKYTFVSNTGPSAVQKWQTLRLSSRHLGKLVRAQRKIGRDVSRAVCGKLASTQALVDWLKETVQGAKKVEGAPVFFDFGQPFVPFCLQADPMW